MFLRHLLFRLHWVLKEASVNFGRALLVPQLFLKNIRKPRFFNPGVKRLNSLRFDIIFRYPFITIFSWLTT